MQVALESRALKGRIAARVVTTGAARGSDRAPLPLLLVHDGGEYARRAGLLRLLGRLAPLRAALVEPLEREEHYAASAAYSRALAAEVLPTLDAGGPRVGLGASLGALALLHAHRARPESFDALLLQSGSYFTRATDAQERGFRRFRRIDGFVRRVLVEQPARRIPVTVTCGRDEENLENNRAVAAALERQGYDVRLVEHPGGHDWPAWRRALDPHLEELLCRAT
ncbi:MAG TPA: alpha/beta hydrolase-fold protein [Gaiellaceae bacterium]|nr:alpha/beta hydrolase-fold protein [Gaiellaceae bacterium]